MATEIANALLPVFFVMAVGYVAGRSGVVDNRDVRSLNTLVMSIALPVSLFTSLASSSRPLIVARWPLAVISTLVMGVVYVGTYVVQRRVFHLAASASAVPCTPGQSSFRAISRRCASSRRVRRSTIRDLHGEVGEVTVGSCDQPGCRRPAHHRRAPDGVRGGQLPHGSASSPAFSIPDMPTQQQTRSATGRRWSG
jgi:hypothetical protein